MKALLFALLLAGAAVRAETVTREEGLAAWERIYEVASHPRCTNCHVGIHEVPMWAGLSSGGGTKHGMGIKADDSRIGAESVPCRTCHLTAVGRDIASPGAPQIEQAWRLPPVELGWLGKEGAELCAQLRDPELNDGHEMTDLVAHLQTSAFVAWGFAPGGGRSVPQGSVAQLVADVTTWAAAGTPCK